MVGKLAPATRAVVFAHLRTILGAAVDDERIAKNPCSAKSVTPPRPVQRRVVPWRYDQVSAIRGGLAQRYRAMVDLGAGCGLRQGEILGLGVDDIDLDAGWVHVSRQVKLVRSRLVFGLPKNDRDRRVPLPDSVALVLRQHIEDCDPVALTLPWENPADDERVTVPLLFTTTSGARSTGVPSTTRAGAPPCSRPASRRPGPPGCTRCGTSTPRRCSTRGRASRPSRRTSATLTLASRSGFTHT